MSEKYEIRMTIDRQALFVLIVNCPASANDFRQQYPSSRRLLASSQQANFAMVDEFSVSNKRKRGCIHASPFSDGRALLRREIKKIRLVCHCIGVFSDAVSCLFFGAIEELWMTLHGHPEALKYRYRTA